MEKKERDYGWTESRVGSNWIRYEVCTRERRERTSAGEHGRALRDHQVAHSSSPSDHISSPRTIADYYKQSSRRTLYPSAVTVSRPPPPPFPLSLSCSLAHSLFHTQSLRSSVSLYYIRFSLTGGFSTPIAIPPPVVRITAALSAYPTA